MLSDKDILSNKPLVAYVENFMTYSDCDKFIDYAKPLIKKSMIVKKVLERLILPELVLMFGYQANNLKQMKF